MSGRLDRWLDRRTPIREGEAELSEEARKRIFGKSQGPVAIPRAAIRQMASSPRYSVETPPGVGEATTSVIMDEEEVGGRLEVVDARILGEKGHKYDTVFSELRTAGAQARHERIANKARRYRLIAPFFGAIALGTVIGALGRPSLVDKDNCYDAIRDGQYIERADNFDTRATQSAGTCELGSHEYVILQQ